MHPVEKLRKIIGHLRLSQIWRCAITACWLRRPKNLARRATNRDVEDNAMWFKLTYSLQEMRLRRSKDAPKHFKYSSNRELTLWVKTDADTSHRPQLCCDALLERSVT